jgi:hypothetical protein
MLIISVTNVLALIGLITALYWFYVFGCWLTTKKTSYRTWRNSRNIKNKRVTP